MKEEENKKTTQLVQHSKPKHLRSLNVPRGSVDTAAKPSIKK